MGTIGQAITGLMVQTAQSVAALEGESSMFAWTNKPIWTHTFDTALFLDNVESDEVTLLWADGTKDFYTLDNDEWIPPAGVFNTLEENSGWTLTTKSQFKLNFLANGRLNSFVDPSGNAVTCTYIDDAQDPADGKLDFVTDAAGRVLDFEYNSLGELAEILAPYGLSDTRMWKLLYEDSLSPGNPSTEGDGFLVSLEDPLGQRITWTYTEDYDLASITDQEENEWILSYGLDPGRLSESSYPIECEFYYAKGSGELYTLYSDARGFESLATFEDFSGNLLSIEKIFFGDVTSFEYVASPDQLIHEVESVTNPLNKTWGYSYDDIGNLLTYTDPHGNLTTFEYDALNNLTYIEPAGETPGYGNPNKAVTLEYTNNDHPTSPTAIIEPADGQGNSAATTVLAYYDDDDAPSPFDPDDWNGLLKSVTDANGVQTLYEYDYWGQMWRLSEGDPQASIGSRVIEATIRDAVGNVIFSGTRVSGAYPLGDAERACLGGVCTQYDKNSNTTQSDCCCWDPDEEGDSVGEPGQSTESSLGLYGCEAVVVVGDLEGPSSFGYEARNFPTDIGTTMNDTSIYPSEQFDINLTRSYGPLGRIAASVTSSNEQTWGTSAFDAPLIRSFGYDYDDVAGQYERTGPDGQTTYVEDDWDDRSIYIERAGLSALYTFYPTGEVETITYGNGMVTTYTFDDARRLTEIAHEGEDYFVLGYEYSADGLILEITEDTSLSGAVTSFDYDNRNRLIEEERVGDHPYHLSYTYDQLGNRLTKTDHVAELTTIYHHDVESPQTYGTRNNRLMYYEVFDDEEARVERVDYEYDAASNGNPTFIVRKKESENFYCGTTLQYHKSGRLWFVVEQTWPEDDEYCDYREIVSILEYRGDGRARYVMRERDPESPTEVLAGTTVWSDYEGDEIYGDYTVDASGDVTETSAYLPGIGQYDSQTGEVSYVQADQVGSLRWVTDDSAQAIGEKVYTAFGEEVYEDGTVATRYQYCGSSGYETFGADKFLHVGFRHYDPATGRFVQRDRVGISGGANVYAYVFNLPIHWIDSTGHMPEWVARGYLWITGGTHSWMDNKATVDKVGTGALAVGAGATIVVTGAAVVAAVGAETATAAAPVVGVAGKKFSENQQALIELAKHAQRVGAKVPEARILLDWAREYGLKAMDHINSSHWIGGPHIHVGPINHIPCS